MYMSTLLLTLHVNMGAPVSSNSSWQYFCMSHNGTTECNEGCDDPRLTRSVTQPIAIPKEINCRFGCMAGTRMLHVNGIEGTWQFQEQQAVLCSSSLLQDLYESFHRQDGSACDFGEPPLDADDLVLAKLHTHQSEHLLQAFQRELTTALPVDLDDCCSQALQVSCTRPCHPRATSQLASCTTSPGVVTHQSALMWAETHVRIYSCILSIS